MESILRELYYGNIAPLDVCEDKTPQARQAWKELHELMDPFEDTLRRHGLLDLHEAVYSAQSQYQMESDAELFARAFCLGARMMLEILDPHMVF